jgi:FHA domain-containing protein
MYDASRYGATCPYCKSEGLEVEIKEDKINLVEEMNDDDKTTAYWSKDTKVDPAVGWITCIEGPDKGQDFRIVSERNFIGRGDDMDIQIKGDSTISRKNHCSISYNPKQRVFMLSPGQSNGLVYVNNEALYDTRELRAYDMIEIGESKFVFVNLCGENFDWNKEKVSDKE